MIHSIFHVYAQDDRISLKMIFSFKPEFMNLKLNLTHPILTDLSFLTFK